MNKSTTQSTMSTNLNKWTRSEPPQVFINSNTRYELSERVVLVQAQYVSGPSGSKQLMVSIDPAAIERKLAIRELNAQIDGRTVKSHTYALPI